MMWDEKGWPALCLKDCMGRGAVVLCRQGGEQWTIPNSTIWCSELDQVDVQNQDCRPSIFLGHGPETL